MREFFRQVFTDALGRWEIKTMLGVVVCVVAVVYGMVKQDWEGFKALAIFGASFFGLSTATDAVIDVVAKNATAKEGQ